MRTVPGFTHLKRGGRQSDILGCSCLLHHSYHSAGTHWASCWWAGSPSLLDRTKKHTHKCKESRRHQRPHGKTAELTSLPSLASHRGQGDTCLLFMQRSNHETEASSDLGRSTELNVKEPARFLNLLKTSCCHSREGTPWERCTLSPVECGAYRVSNPGLRMSL